MKIKAIVIVAFLIASSMIGMFGMEANAALNPSTEWSYYKQITISNAVTNYQLRIHLVNSTGTDSGDNIYVGGKCENFPFDIRFGTTSNASNATMLPQWLEWYNSTDAYYWVNISTYSTIYLFMGNSAAEEYSDGDAVFLQFINASTTGWTTANLTVTNNFSDSILGQALRVFSNDTVNDGRCYHNLSLTSPYIMEMKFRTVSIGGKDQLITVLSDGSAYPPQHRLSQTTTPKNGDQNNIYYLAGGSSFSFASYTEGNVYILRHKVDESNSSSGIDYYIFDEHRNELGNATGKSFATGSPSATHYIYLGDMSSGGVIDTRIAWIIFRKYAYPEPTIFTGVNSPPTLSNPKVIGGNLNSYLIYDENSYRAWGVSGIEMPNGDIIAAWEWNTAETGIAGKIQAAISTDGGYTWDSVYTLQDTANLRDTEPQFMVLNNTVWFFYTAVNESDANRASHIYYRTSTDNGSTWGNATEIPFGDTSAFTISNPIIKQHDPHKGRIILPIWIASSSPHIASVLYSDDNGVTWHRGGNMSLASGHINEPTVVELSNGTLYALLRYEGGMWQYESYSTDGGTTWTTPRASSIQSPRAQSKLLRLHNGHYMLLWDNAQSSINTPRYPLTVAVSTNNCQTWHKKTNIREDSGIFSNMELIQKSNGEIVALYTDGNPVWKIWSAVFPEQNLTALLNTTYVAVPPKAFQITISDSNGDAMTVTILENSSGAWKVVNQSSGLSNGTYTFTNTSWITQYNHTYYIRFNVSDGNNVTTETFKFTTIPPSNNPPSCSITSPSNGATVSGTVTIQGTASDSDGTVQKVEVKIDDGTWQQATGTTSWSYSWDTTGVSDGSHTIYARSYDGTDYSTESSVTVTVNNTQPNHAPVLSNPSPANGSTNVSLKPNVSIHVSDPDGDTMTITINLTNADGGWQVTTFTGGNGTYSIGNLNEHINTSGKTYYWKVTADDGTATTTATYHFTTQSGSSGNHPPTITLLQPADGATNVSINATLGVTIDDADNDSVTIVFYDASTNQPIGPSQSIAPETPYNVYVHWNGLNYNTTYSWYVTADDGTATTTSPTWSFTTEANTSNGNDSNGGGWFTGSNGISIWILVGFMGFAVIAMVMIVYAGRRR